MQIVKGVQASAPKVLLYGNAGVGKSTLAAKMTKPLFMDLEGGANYIGVDRVQIKDEDELMKCLVELAKERSKEYDTIVIDSADMLVRRISEKVAGVGVVEEGPVTLSAKKKTMERNLMDAQGGYGKAKEVLENHIRGLLIPMLENLNRMGYAIVLIAHAYTTSVLDDDGMEAVKVLPKIDPPTIGKKPIATPAFTEWVDNVLYLKKVGEDRFIQVESDNSIMAKNRIGLTGEYDVAKQDINELLTVKKDK